MLKKKLQRNRLFKPKLTNSNKRDNKSNLSKDCQQIRWLKNSKLNMKLRGKPKLKKNLIEIRETV